MKVSQPPSTALGPTVGEGSWFDSVWPALGSDIRSEFAIEAWQWCQRKDAFASIVTSELACKGFVPLETW